ncbi:MAG: ribonuclease T [Rhodobacteraceae bacterium]|nr:MAG: ribonuclease T [Paracoccaceae bacterium]
MRWVFIWIIAAMPAWAEGEKAGAFDYYVLSLSWSPNWCALQGDRQGSEQCEERYDYGWVMHGLWPQYQRGFPSFCQGGQRPPSRALTADMADIMGTPGLAWYQWKKHGVCTGLSAPDYFALSRLAYEKVVRPPVFRKLEKTVKVPASVVEEAFLKANPDWKADMLTITCKNGYIQEARLCLSRNLQPVPCGQDVIRDCQMSDALFTPVR